MIYRATSRGRSKNEEPLYNRVELLRVERGLSRKDLAEQTGIHYQTVGYLERGEYAPSLHLAFRLSDFFDVAIEDIFSTSPFPIPTRSSRRADA